MLSSLEPNTTCFDIYSLYQKKKKRSDLFDFKKCRIDNRIHQLQSFYNSIGQKRLYRSNTQSELLLPNILSPERKTVIFKRTQRYNCNKEPFINRELNVVQLKLGNDIDNCEGLNDNQLTDFKTNAVIDSLLSIIEENKDKIYEKINQAIQLDEYADLYVREAIKDTDEMYSQRELMFKKTFQFKDECNKNSNSHNGNNRRQILHMKHIKFDEIIDKLINHCLDIRNTKNQSVSINNIENFFDIELKQIKDSIKDQIEIKEREIVEEVTEVNSLLTKKFGNSRFKIDCKQLYINARNKNQNKKDITNKTFLTNKTRSLIKNKNYLSSNMLNRNEKSTNRTMHKYNYVNQYDFDKELEQIDEHISKKSNLSKEIFKEITNIIKKKLYQYQYQSKSPYGNMSREPNRITHRIPSSVIQQLQKEITLNKVDRQIISLKKRSKSSHSLPITSNESRNVKYHIKECYEANLSSRIDSDKMEFSYDNNSIRINPLYHTSPNIQQNINKREREKCNDDEKQEETIQYSNDNLDKESKQVIKYYILEDNDNDNKVKTKEVGSNVNEKQLFNESYYIKRNILKEANETGVKLKATQSIDTTEQTSRLLDPKVIKMEKQTIKDIDIDIPDEEEEEDDKEEEEESDINTHDDVIIEEIKPNISNKTKQISKRVINDDVVSVIQPKKESKEKKVSERQISKPKDKIKTISKPTKKKIVQNKTNAKKTQANKKETMLNKIIPIFMDDESDKEARIKKQKAIFTSINDYFTKASYCFDFDSLYHSESFLMMKKSKLKQKKHKYYRTISYGLRNKFYWLKHLKYKETRIPSPPPLHKDQVEYLNQDKKKKYTRKKLNSVERVKDTLNPHKSELKRKLTPNKAYLDELEDIGFNDKQNAIKSKIEQSKAYIPSATQTQKQPKDGQDTEKDKNESENKDKGTIKEAPLFDGKNTIDVYQQLLGYENKGKETLENKSSSYQGNESIWSLVKAPNKNKFKPIATNKKLNIKTLDTEKINPIVIKTSLSNDSKEVITEEKKETSKALQLLDHFKAISLLASEDYTKKLTEMVDVQMLKSNLEVQRKLEERMNDFKTSLCNNIKLKANYRRLIGSKVLFRDNIKVRLC